ncbi:hypothetical protein [Halobacterium salinarum]|uniref:hypothetical protein n=1 Tax=Halobacterium salinarum TaxID=2242 RepID=UPI002555C9DD|nr:hypothetical protein [Halobacterium salinarum]MDL0123069.1 hypothetical protein [Halobacterium salinarum]
MGLPEYQTVMGIVNSKLDELGKISGISLLRSASMQVLSVGISLEKLKQGTKH